MSMRPSFPEDGEPVRRPSGRSPDLPGPIGAEIRTQISARIGGRSAFDFDARIAVAIIGSTLLIPAMLWIGRAIFGSGEP